MFREAKTHLSRFLERVLAGEEVVIARSGHPIARLVPYGSPPENPSWGFIGARVWMSEDFDAPLPEESAGRF